MKALVLPGGSGFTGWHFVRMLNHPVALRAS